MKKNDSPEIPIQKNLNKPLKTLKIAFVLIFTVFTSSYAAENNRLSIDVKDTPLKDVFTKIEKGSSFVFFFSDDVRPLLNRRVSLQVKSQTIDFILDHLLSLTSLKYRIDDRQISILKKESVNPSGKIFTVKGRVTDVKGEILTGAGVKNRRTGLGISTDQNGEFSLQVSSGDALNISYIGCETQTVPDINNDLVLHVILKEDTKVIDEVVVVGYGTQLKSDVTAAIGSYKPSEMSARQSLGVEDLLQGRVPGVVISSSSGVPGSKNRVSIRGAGSLSASNEPLYVIDGVPVNTSNADLGNFGQSMNALDNLNPEDIESIDVLKDASSAAIYGSRATNGVIIITTKTGSKGKAKVEVSASTGIQQLTRTNRLKVADSETYLEVMNEAIDNWNLQKGENEIARMDNPYPGKADTDWLDLILRTAQVQNISLSVSGGNDHSNYYISGNAKHHEGVFKGNAMDKYNLRVSQNSDIRKWVSIGSNLTLSFSNNNRVPTGYDIGTNLLPRALEQCTWDSPVKPDGSWYKGGAELMNHNPVQILNEENVYVRNYKVLGSGFAKFNITKDISFKTTFGGDVTYTEEHIYYTAEHPYGNGLGKLIDGRRLLTSVLEESLITYNHKFAKLSLNAIAGHSFQRDATSSASQTGLGFPSSSFDVNSVAAEVQDVSTGLSEYALQSYFTRAMFSYDSRYLLALSMRADGSSRFAPENRYGYFPSVSTGWIMSEEQFWPIPHSSAKLRASYGSTGNQAGIGTYAYQALAGGGFNYNGVNGLGISGAGNRNLEWEKANQADVGIDLSFFNGAITFTADAFIKDTKNLLYSKPTAASTGFTSYFCNIGSMRNKGLEFALNTNLVRKDFQWRSDFNISFVKNKLTALLGEDNIIRPDATHILKVGEEVGSFYMIKQIGIYQTNDEIPEKIYAEGVRAGDCMYEDVNKDGKIDQNNDSRIVGSANPKFSGGFNNTLIYKGFDLSIFFTTSYGNKLYQLWTGGYRLGNGAWPMLQSEADKRWTGPGTSNSVPRAIYGVSWNSTKFQTTRFLHDASYIRCRNVSLGYTLPKKLTKTLNIESCRLYVQADNLFILTKYPLLDPEVSVSLAATQMGYDFLLPSQPRAFNFGINVKF